MLLVASGISLYKPILSGAHEVSQSHDLVCSGNPSMHQMNFILDILYGLLITALPFILITTLNIFILKTLLSRNLANNGHTKVIFKENRVRLEVTLILLSISTCFILLNMPYFVVWCIQYILNSEIPGSLEEVDNHSKTSIAMANINQLYITRTIFYMNYSINVFLYCLTGKQYRVQVKQMFLCCAPRPRNWGRFVSPALGNEPARSFSMA